MLDPARLAAIRRLADARRELRAAASAYANHDSEPSGDATFAAAGLRLEAAAEAVAFAWWAASPHRAPPELDELLQGGLNDAPEQEEAAVA